MNIGFIISDVTLERGGERAAITLANALVETNQVHIVSLYQKNSKPFFTVDDKIAIHYINKYPADGFSLKKIALKLSEFNGIRRKLNQKDIDIWIGVSTYCSIMLGLVSLFKPKSKIIAWEHANFEAAGNKWRLLRKFTYRHLNAIVCLTTADQEKYQKEHVKVVQIPNALPFNNGTKKSNLSNKIILAIGALAHEKGFDLLIEAFAKIATETDWVMYIVGSGEEKVALEKLILAKQLQKRIMIFPATKQIEEVYTSASIFVLPSRREGFGMVLIEAMHFGLPCIAFDCPTGPSSIITNHVNGILVSEGSIDELGNQLKNLIQKPYLGVNLASNANLALAKYQLKNVLPQWLSLFKSISE